MDHSSNIEKDLRTLCKSMLMLALNDTKDQWVMANSIHWHGHVLRREDGQVLRRA